MSLDKHCREARGRMVKAVMTLSGGIILPKPEPELELEHEAKEETKEEEEEDTGARNTRGRIYQMSRCLIQAA